MHPEAKDLSWYTDEVISILKNEFSIKGTSFDEKSIPIPVYQAITKDVVLMLIRKAVVDIMIAYRGGLADMNTSEQSMLFVVNKYSHLAALDTRLKISNHLLHFIQFLSEVSAKKFIVWLKRVLTAEYVPNNKNMMNAPFYMSYATEAYATT